MAMESITRNDLKTLFQALADTMARHSEELCDMDAKMGDGDLGLTMKKGFGALPAILDEIDEADPGKAMMKSGMKMASVVPSTMGTLMSSGLMSAGKAVAGSEALGAKEFAAWLGGYAEGIQKRGKCERGDRTVLDSIGPAADAAAGVLAENPAATLAGVAEAACTATRQGLEATRDMKPKFGKAAVHAAKAAGVVDQGAYAGCLMVCAVCDTILGT